MKQPQLVNGDYPAEVTAGTGLLFVNSDCVKREHTTGVEAPFFQVIETERKLSDVKLQITSNTTHKFFTEAYIKRLVRETIRKFFTEFVNVTGRYVPFVGTRRVLLTIEFRKF